MYPKRQTKKRHRGYRNKNVDTAAETLLFSCGLKVGRMTVRKLCYAEAPKMAEWMQRSPEVTTEFIKAPGNVEITIDATRRTRLHRLGISVECFVAETNL